MGANLYGRLEKEVAQHAGALVAGLVTQTEDPAAFLAEVHRVWSMHCEQMVRAAADARCVGCLFVCALARCVPACVSPPCG